MSRRKRTLLTRTQSASVPLAPSWEQLLAEAMAPLPDEFRWQPWDLYEHGDEPEQVVEDVPSLLGLCDDSTQFLPVIDFVLANEFPTRIPAQRTGAVL